MELTSDGVAQTVFPTAAFTPRHQIALPNDKYTIHKEAAWLASMLNPKNRIDSLDYAQDPKWRIDGCASLGTQFYALPLFLTPLNPMRIDVFIPEASKIPPALRKLLDVHTAFYLRDARVADLGISRYIVRVLELWSSQYRDFRAFHNGLPFGSRIVFENITADIKDVRIQVVKTHFLERQLLSCESLQAKWDISHAWPATVDISAVHLLRQLHDSVSLVRIGNQRYILKALTSSPKYLYHELKVLLALPAHPNIVSRPIHIVTKQCNFGGKVAAIGFTLRYHEKGTLRDLLPRLRMHDSLRRADQLAWAIQLTEALICIREAGRFYCDLRLDNVVLDDHDGIVMIDFEARGVAFSASAPEVNYLEYIYSIATDADSEAYPGNAREKFRQLYGEMVRRWKIQRSRESYANPEHGYSVPWLCLDEKEREAAEVYMLGRVLWCIFEGIGSPEKTVMVQHLREDELEFPQWNRTPDEVRSLIERCIRFSDGYRRLPVVRRGNMIVVRDMEEERDSDETREVARRWWDTELDLAEVFLRQKLGGEGAIYNFPFGRPTLDEVLMELKKMNGSDV